MSYKITGLNPWTHCLPNFSNITPDSLHSHGSPSVQQQMSKSCCALRLRCQFCTCNTKIAPVKFRPQMCFQDAAAISKRICDFKTHLQPSLHRCDFLIAGAISKRRCNEVGVFRKWQAVIPVTKLETVWGGLFATNITNLMVYLFISPIYIYNASMYSSIENVFVILHVVVGSGNVLHTLFSSIHTIIFSRFQIWPQQFYL